MIILFIYRYYDFQYKYFIYLKPLIHSWAKINRSLTSPNKLKARRKVNENNGTRLLKTFSSSRETTAHVVLLYCLPPFSLDHSLREVHLMPRKSIFCPLLTKLIGLGIDVNEVDWPQWSYNAIYVHRRHTLSHMRVFMVYGTHTHTHNHVPTHTHPQ